MTATETLQAAVEALGLDIVQTFVPWSQSRNKGERHPSLNWSVCLRRNGRQVLTADYSAGCGHCPSYRQGDRSVDAAAAVKEECHGGRDRRGKKIEASPLDVIHSLVSDAGALDYATFEEWCADFGSDPDSRKAEAIYRACLEIGLKLRSALGDDGLRQLREACQGY